MEDSLESLRITLKNATAINRNITFEVFVHKTDGLSEENKFLAMRQVRNVTMDYVKQLNLQRVQLSFHATSIYDHSIFEAFSKVSFFFFFGLEFGLVIVLSCFFNQIFCLFIFISDSFSSSKKKKKKKKKKGGPKTHPPNSLHSRT